MKSHLFGCERSNLSDKLRNTLHQIGLNIQDDYCWVNIFNFNIADFIVPHDIKAIFQIITTSELNIKNANNIITYLITILFYTNKIYPIEHWHTEKHLRRETSRYNSIPTGL